MGTVVRWPLRAVVMIALLPLYLFLGALQAGTAHFAAVLILRAARRNGALVTAALVLGLGVALLGPVMLTADAAVNPFHGPLTSAEQIEQFIAGLRQQALLARADAP